MEPSHVQTQEHMTSSEGRIPPQAVEVEESVLGSMLIEREACDIALETLKADDFYKPAHRHVFESLSEVYLNNSQVDLLSVEEHMRDKGLLDKAGGSGFLADLTRSVSSSANIEFHAKIIKDKSVKRRAIIECNEIIKNAYDSAVEASEVIDNAQERIFSLYKDESGTTYSIGESLKSVINEINEIQEKGVRKGIQTGLDIDDLTMGFEKGKYYVIAARPSMGKTGMALTIMREMANRSVNSAILSLETSHTSLAFRLLTSVSKISTDRLKSPNLQDYEVETILNSAHKLSEYGIYLDDTLSLSDQQLRAKTRNLIRKHNIGALVIDFMQLMEADGDTREREVAKISRAIKITCKECDIPVIALSQLSRKNESRSDKRPMLSDLRESGAIEQDADVIMFLHRPEYYGTTTYPDGTSTENVCEIIIAKNKDGKVGTRKLLFLKDQMRFENLDSLHTGTNAPVLDSYYDNDDPPMPHSVGDDDESPF